MGYCRIIYSLVLLHFRWNVSFYCLAITPLPNSLLLLPGGLDKISWTNFIFSTAKWVRSTKLYLTDSVEDGGNSLVWKWSKQIEVIMLDFTFYTLKLCKNQTLLKLYKAIHKIKSQQNKQEAQAKKPENISSLP